MSSKDCQPMLSLHVVASLRTTATKLKKWGQQNQYKNAQYSDKYINRLRIFFNLSKIDPPSGEPNGNNNLYPQY